MPKFELEDIDIRKDDLKVDTFRSSGAGGQHVNKVATAIHLRFDIRNSQVLPDAVRNRLLESGDQRITADGVLVIKSQESRSQERNRQAALQRLADIVRAYPGNQLGWWDKVVIYGSRWWEYLSAEPREANSEGGVWPAIFGTVAMTIIMAVAVVPFGVLAALILEQVDNTMSDPRDVEAITGLQHPVDDLVGQGVPQLLGLRDAVLVGSRRSGDDFH